MDHDDDPDLTAEERLELLREEAGDHGKCVFSHSYDSSDSPAGSAWAVIYLYQGKYFPAADFDLLEHGPFATLDEAIERSGIQEFVDHCPGSESDEGG